MSRDVAPDPLHGTTRDPMSPMPMPVRETAESSAADVRRHRMATVAGVVASCVLLAGVRWLRSAWLTAADDILCSNHDTECPCSTAGADDGAFSARTAFVRIALTAVVLGSGLESFRAMVQGALGPPRRPVATRVLFVGGTVACYGGYAVVGGSRATLMVLVTLLILLMAAQWAPRMRRRALRAVVPFLVIPVLTLVFTVLFYVLLPFMVEDYSGSALSTMVVLGLVRTSWSLALWRLFNGLLDNNWPPAQQSLILRMLTAASAGGRVSSSLLVAKQRGDMVTRTFVAGLCLYVAIQLVLRQNGLTVLRGRYWHRHSDAETLRQQSTVLAMYGSVRDWRFLCYPVLALMHALNADGMQLFLTDCDGEVRADDFFPAWHFLALMLASDVVLEVLLHLSQRWLKRRNPNTPFRSAEFVAPPTETFLLTVYQVWSHTIGAGAILTLLERAD